MDTQLLDAIRIIMREELKAQDERIDAKFQEQDERIDIKFDVILEAWDIQKVHRQELDNHESRIQTIEHRMPAIS